MSQAGRARKLVAPASEVRDLGGVASQLDGFLVRSAGIRRAAESA
jgi:hypothetical protein